MTFCSSVSHLTSTFEKHLRRFRYERAKEQKVPLGRALRLERKDLLKEHNLIIRGTKHVLFYRKTANSLGKMATHEVHGRNGNKYLVVVLELNLAYFPNRLLLQPLARDLQARHELL